MAGAFQLLRSNDLVWSHNLRQYLLGERPPLTDLMAWNADATRMPARMHGEYLRRLFLENDLAEGRYQVGGRPVSLGDIAVPVFAVGTTRDHVAPWRSVYKLHLFTDTELTFLLASGGHNVGVVNPPGAANGRASYQLATRERGAHYVDPAAWAERASVRPGSWWPAWQGWLAERSGAAVAPPPLGDAEAGDPPPADAPGLYVLQR
jgi:polyhydroxyalkanoate synthase